MCSEHGIQPSGDGPCCIIIKINYKESPVPEEQIPEHVKCSAEECKSIYWRPREADGALSTIDLAQLRGWTLVDREKGLLHCAWGHKD